MIAIVTGGADGIGWATAQRLAADGAQVVIADLQARLWRAVQRSSPLRLINRRWLNVPP